MVRQSQNDGLSVTRLFFPSECEIVGYWLLQGRASLRLSSLLFFLHLLPLVSWWTIWPNRSSVPLRQGWQKTGVIRNGLDTLPKQHPLWENIPIIGRAPIITHFLRDDDGWHLCWQVWVLRPSIPSPDQILRNPGHLVSNTPSFSLQRQVVGGKDI